MNEPIHVEESALQDLRDSFATAGESYKSNLARLTNLMQEITSGDIQGDPANDLLELYEAKKEMFQKLADEVDDAQEAMGIETKSFQSMIGDLGAGMR